MLQVALVLTDRGLVGRVSDAPGPTSNKYKREELEEGLAKQVAPSPIHPRRQFYIDSASK